MIPEEDYLMLSGIQHYCYCPRQWGLIHVAQIWSDDARTSSGNIMHRNADNPFSDEIRHGVVISRAMPVSSSKMGLSGRCDVVEFVPSEDGFQVCGHEGKFTIVPVEYKIGHRKSGDLDCAQLCAQAMALEETMNVTIDFGYIYYGSERRRQKVEFGVELRDKVLRVVGEMHKLYREGKVPSANYVVARCRGCSLLDECMPQRVSWKSVDEYIQGLTWKI